MRKISLFGSLVAVSMLAIGGTALAAAPTGTFSFKVSPTKTSTKEKWQPIRATFGGKIDPLPGAIQPPPATELNVEFKDKAAIDRRAVKGTAKLADMKKTGDCSSRYRLATGKVTAHAGTLMPRLDTNLNVCIIEREPGDVVTLGLGADVASIWAVIVVKGHLKLKNGRLLLKISGNLPTVVGVTPVVSAISAKTRILSGKIGKKNRRTVHLLNAPRTCKKNGKKVRVGKSGLYSAVLKITFQDADPVELTGTSKCRQVNGRLKKR